MTSTLPPATARVPKPISRRRVAVLALSLGLNLTLLGALFRQYPATLAKSTGSTTRLDNAAAPVAAPQSWARVDAKTWESLTSGNLTDAIARLKGAGIPAQLLRVIVTALVDAQYASRHHEIAEMIRARAWWQPQWGGDAMNIFVARQKLRREIDDKVDDLIGADLGDEYMQASRRYRYGNLPLATLALLDRINADYTELESEIKAEARGILLDEDKEKLRYLSEQNDAETTALMTPEQRSEYELHGGATAWFLRWSLQHWNPSDDEFRAIYKVQQQFMKPFADGNKEVWTAEMSEAFEKTKDQLKEQIRGVLSPERFAEYELKTDPAYHATAPLVDRLQLPASATADIVTVQRDITKRADAVRADSALTAQTRAAQLGALADEANLRLASTLGDSGLAAYRNGPGLWLTTLKPAAPKH